MDDEQQPKPQAPWVRIVALVLIVALVAFTVSAIF